MYYVAISIIIHQPSHALPCFRRPHPRSPVRPKPLVREEAGSEFNRDSAVAATLSPHTVALPGLQPSFPPVCVRSWEACRSSDFFFGTILPGLCYRMNNRRHDTGTCRYGARYSITTCLLNRSSSKTLRVGSTAFSPRAGGIFHRGFPLLSQSLAAAICHTTSKHYSISTG